MNTMNNTQHDNLKQQGLVISYYGSTVAVCINKGEIIQCHLRRNQALPVVGDHVLFEYEKEEAHKKGVILDILPRKSVLERYEGRPGKMKPIAANIDIMMVVMAPPPILSEYLIDRYTIAAELLKIPVGIILNKIDLIKDNELSDVEARLLPYQNLGYPLLLSSIYRPDELNALSVFLRDQSAVLVGPSGVGKSSLIARLSGIENIPINQTTTKGIGKHTTTATRLYQLPEGGSLIDSPGVREFNLWPISQEELQRGYKELKAFTKDCKFRDCQHIAEPGCGVQMAVEAGKISRERYQNYQMLWKKNAHQK